MEVKVSADPQRTIVHWVIQFREHGLKGLEEAEKSGRPEILSPAQKAILATAVAKSPKALGLKADAWTGGLVSSFLQKRWGIKLTARHCYRLLRLFKDETKI
jgi:transposase